MPIMSLKTHYDGRHILLDEPFQLPTNARLIVTVLEPKTLDERDAWADLAAGGLARAYGDDEPEYTIDDLKP